MDERTCYVYILARKKNGTLYAGRAVDLQGRVYTHKTKAFPGFSKKYGVARLVWYTEVGNGYEALMLERKIKNRGRKWKIDLIERENPNWYDLAARWYD